MQCERHISRVFFVHLPADPVRFHPGVQRNVRFVHKLQTAHQRMQRIQHFLLGYLGRPRQPFLVLEQLDEQESRREKLHVCARPPAL